MMPRLVLFGVLAFWPTSLLTQTAGEQPARNIWKEQYERRSAESLAKQFESPSRPVYRLRLAIVGLLELRPGMTVAEIGAGSGFLSRIIAGRVGAQGHAVATELDAKMVAYMNARARKEGVTNFRAVRGETDRTGLAPASADAVLVVNTYSFLEQPAEMLSSIAEALRPGGMLVIVDFPLEGSGAHRSGVDPQDVTRVATHAGFTLLDEHNIIPGHFTLRFKRR